MHSFQVMHLFDANGGRETKRGRGKDGEGERGGGGERKRGEGKEKTKERNTKRQDRTPHRDGRGKSLITMYYLMCGNAQGRVFINTVDTKHSLIQKHKEHFALADIINSALSSTKTEMKRGNNVLYNKSCQ